MAKYAQVWAAGSFQPGRLKHNLSATVDPTTGDDDATGGYADGSLWVNTTSGDIFGCVDAASGTWEQLTAKAGSLHTDLSVSGAHTIDRDDGETHDLTLTGNATFTLAGALTDKATDLRLILRQDGTGSRTVTWPAITWVGGSAPTLQTAANAVDTIGLLSVDDGVTWFGYAVEDAVQDHGGLTGLSDDDHPQYRPRKVVMRTGITAPPEPVQNVDGDGWVYAEAEMT